MAGRETGRPVSQLCATKPAALNGRNYGWSNPKASPTLEFPSRNSVSRTSSACGPVYFKTNSPLRTYQLPHDPLSSLLGGVYFRQVCATRVVLMIRSAHCSAACTFGKSAQLGWFFHQRRSVTHGLSASTPRDLRKEEIHVISDAIAKLMAGSPHTI